MLMENTIIDSYLIGVYLYFTLICISYHLIINWPKTNSFSYRRDEIIEVVKHRFAEKMNQNLPIFGIDKANLKDFTTTEKDFKKG